MASGRSSWFRRCLHRLAPWLFWKCPAGNLHWGWDNRVCYCRYGEYGGGWHGGIWVDGKEVFKIDD